MIKFLNTDLVELGGVQFGLIQELNPKRNSAGEIQQFMPQLNYSKSADSRLNLHGKGPFCKFSINLQWAGHRGVYALFSDEKLLYIGECADLHKRYNIGYGNISPKNCFNGGQSTNCKINTMILKKYLDGKKVMLYFHETDDYKRVESILIGMFKPPYNSSGVHALTPSPTKKLKIKVRTILILCGFSGFFFSIQCRKSD